jgi:hypothetical protein
MQRLCNRAADAAGCAGDQRALPLKLNILCSLSAERFQRHFRPPARRPRLASISLSMRLTRPASTLPARSVDLGDAQRFHGEDDSRQRTVASPLHSNSFAMVTASLTGCAVTLPPPAPPAAIVALASASSIASAAGCISAQLERRADRQHHAALHALLGRDRDGALDRFLGAGHHHTWPGELSLATPRDQLGVVRRLPGIFCTCLRGPGRAGPPWRRRRPIPFLLHRLAAQLQSRAARTGPSAPAAASAEYFAGERPATWLALSARRQPPSASSTRRQRC